MALFSKVLLGVAGVVIWTRVSRSFQKSPQMANDSSLAIASPLPPLPLFSCRLPQCARLFCPNLVTMISYVSKELNIWTVGIGFIIFASVNEITVWGPSFFLYEDEKFFGRTFKKVREGKVFVSIGDGVYDGDVAHVDLRLDVAVIKIKLLKSFDPTTLSTRPASVVKSTSSPRKVVCLDFMPCLGGFFMPRVYDVKDCHHTNCRHGVHVDWTLCCNPTIILENGFIFGFKMGRCKYSETLADVVLLKELFDALCQISPYDIQTRHDSEEESDSCDDSKSLSLLGDAQPFFDNLRVRQTDMLVPHQEYPVIYGA